MKIVKVTSIFLFLVFISIFLYSEVVSSVKTVKTFGEVHSQKPGQAVWDKVKQNDILGPNYTIRTGWDSYTELELSPENTVRLKEKSQMLIKELDKESLEPDGQVVKLTDFNLIEGDITLKLDKLPKNTIIQVSSPTAVAGARGTAYVVRYNSGEKITRVGVLNNMVNVQSAGEPAKVVMVPTFKKVSVTPWAMATPQVRGTGILSEKILGKPFVDLVNTPVMQAKGTGDTESKAKYNAYLNLAKKIQSISITMDKRIEDVLEENPSLCQPLYSYITKAEIISTQKVNNMVEVTAQLALAPISDIIQRPIPPMPAIVKPIAMKEYSDKFGPQARATTQRAAQLDGYRKLAEIMYGTVISSTTILKDMVIKYDRIITIVEGVVKGAEILDTQYFSDGSITVFMAIRADLVRLEVVKITGDIFGLNYFTSPTVIDIDDYLE